MIVEQRELGLVAREVLDLVRSVPRRFIRREIEKFGDHLVLFVSVGVLDILEIARSTDALVTVRKRALKVIFDVALEQPNTSLDLEELRAIVVDADDTELQAAATLVLGAIADERGEAVVNAVDRPAIGAIVELLDGEEASHREAASSLCSCLVVRSPDARDRVLPVLFDLLEDESHVVRANAVWALSLSLESSLDDRSKREIGDVLRTVSETDDDPDIRALTRALLEESTR